MGVTLEYEILADSKRARAEMGRFGKKVDTTTGKVKASFGKMGGAIGLVFGAAAIRQVSRFASELSAVGREAIVFEANADRIFGTASDSIATWADESRRQFGTSSAALEGLAARFGVYLDGAGYAEQASADMAKQLTELAGALSYTSAGQYDVNAATEAVTGAFRGEYEQLQTLGINIDAASVKERALTESIMSQAEATGISGEALAALEIIFGQTGDEMEAFAERSDAASAAATSDWEEFKTEVGKFAAESSESFATWALGLKDNATAGFQGAAQEGDSWWDNMSYKFGSGLERLTGNWGNFWSRFQGGADKLRAAADHLGAGWARGFNDMSLDLNSSFSAITSMFGILGGVITAFVEFVWNLGPNLLSGLMWPFEQFGRLASNIVHGVGSGLSSLNPLNLLPGRASGGPVTGGSAYVVGERGPELFVPPSSGSIIANGAGGAGGGGNTYSISVSVAAASPSDVGQAIVESIEEYERFGGTGWRAA